MRVLADIGRWCGDGGMRERAMGAMVLAFGSLQERGRCTHIVATQTYEDSSAEGTHRGPVPPTGAEMDTPTSVIIWMEVDPGLWRQHRIEVIEQPLSPLLAEHGYEVAIPACRLGEETLRVLRQSLHGGRVPAGHPWRVAVQRWMRVCASDVLLRRWSSSLRTDLLERACGLPDA